ncbi:unnamed protein product, partial [marine sediment metagenome]
FVMIDSPSDSQILSGLQVVGLRATATDPEDGQLGGASINWASDLDGPLGTGSPLTVSAADLSESEHVLTAKATDSMGNQGVAEVTIQVFRVRPANLPPKADAGADRTVEWTQNPIGLDGTASSDPNGDPLSYAWSVASGPAGSSAAPDDPSSATPSFVPDLLGTYVFELVVGDGKLESAPDSVEITVVDTTPPQAFCNAPPTIVPVHKPILFKATATDIGDADPDVTITAFDCFKV